MPPKKKTDGPPPPPPEANPEDQLPEEIRNLTEAPFPVSWHPVVTIVQLCEEIKAGPLKETLRRKELVRTPHINDLFLRVDPASQLGTDIRAAYDAHTATGEAFETFVLAPEHAAAVLQERFQRDERVDWKLECHRRNTALQAAEDEVKASEEAQAAADTALQAAQAELQQWQEEQALARAAAAEDALEGEGEPEVVEPSTPQLAHAAAEEAASACQQRCQAAAEQLAVATAQRGQPFVCHQMYWVEGLGSSVEAIERVVAAGVLLRAAIWGKPLQDPVPAPAAAEDAAAAGAAAAAAADAQLPVTPPLPPDLFSALKSASRSAAWDSRMGFMVALEVELPPTPPDPEEEPAKDAKKKPDKGKKGKAEEPPPALTVPVDTPGWDTLASVLDSLKARVSAYDKWRDAVTVYQVPGREASEPVAMHHYEALLEGVEPERISVPVMMHAMLEQVTRSMQQMPRSIQQQKLQQELQQKLQQKSQQELCSRLKSNNPEDDATLTKESSAEEEAASSWALGALCSAFEVFEAAEKGQVFCRAAPGSNVDNSGYTLVHEGDQVAVSATGLATGFVRCLPSCPAQPRPGSPTSPLDHPMACSQHTSATASIMEEDGERELPAAVGGTAVPPPPFLPATGTLDVDAVEAYMLGVAEVHGIQSCLLDHPSQDPIGKALRDTAIRAQAGPDGVPLAAIQRYEVLQAAADLLPPSAKETHEADILARHHTEALSPGTLKQVVNRALLQLPHRAHSYQEVEGGVVLALFAGSYERREGGGLPVAISFATYWERVLQASQTAEELEMPDIVYQVAPELSQSAEHGVLRRFQYSEEGTIIASAPGVAPAMISKGPTTVLLSSADGAPKLITTLDGGATVCAYRADAPPLLPQSPSGPSPEDLAAAAAAAAAADAAAAEALEAAAKKPGSGRKGSATKSAGKAKAKGVPDAPEQTPPLEPVPVPEPEPAPAEPAAPAGPPPPDPVLSIQVCTPRGALVEINTEGSVILTAAPADCQPHRLPAVRGVEVYGAPIPAGDLSALAPPMVVRRVVRPDGSLVTSFSDGSLHVLHADGTGSKRVQSIEDWCNPEDGSVAKGWLRTRPDGTRYCEPDEGSQVPAPPAPEPAIEVEAPAVDPKAAAAAAKGAKGKAAPPPAPAPEPTKEEAPEPVPPPPWTVELPPLAVTEVTDPDSGALIVTREDMLMTITYPSGEQLTMDSDGTRVSRLPSGAWAIEFNGVMPPVHGDGRGDMQVVPSPGISLHHSGVSNTVTCDLPGGSSMLVRQPLAIYIPAEVDAYVASLTNTMDSLAQKALEAGAEVGARLAADVAESHGWRGTVVLDMVSGQAAMAGDKPGVQGGPPVGFRLAAGCRHMEQWPEPLPLSWDEASVPEPVPELGTPWHEVSDLQQIMEAGGEAVGIEKSSTEVQAEDAAGLLRQASRPPRLSVAIPPMPTPEPVHHVNPVAPGVVPRIFVVFRSGDGYEVLDSRAAALTADSGLRGARAVRGSRPLPGAAEPGVMVHTLLQHVPPTSAELLPLPVGLAALVQRHSPGATEVLCGSLPEPTSAANAVASLPIHTSKWQYVPRMVAYEPPQLHPSPSLPVLAYREILEYPRLDPDQHEEIQQLLAAAESASASKCKMQDSAVPLSDDRDESQRQEENEVLSLILAMRKQHAGRTIAPDSIQEAGPRSSAPGAPPTLLTSMHSGDGQLPVAMPLNNNSVPASVHGEEQSEDGTEGRRSDAKAEAPLPRPALPPRLPPSSGYASPGPSHGLASSQPAQQQQLPQSLLHGLSPPQAQPQLAPASAAKPVLGLSPQRTGGLRPGMLKPVDYNYPKPGQSLVSEQQLPNMDAYGQLRTQVVPPLPEGYRPDDAIAAGAGTTGGAVPKAPAAPLIRWAGKEDRQLALKPTHIHFGNVPAGTVAHRTATLRNVSTGAARYTVTRPELPLRVIHKPGPVAPGTEAVLTIEFVGQLLGDFVGELVVRTEKDVLKLSVSARVVLPGGVEAALSTGHH